MLCRFPRIVFKCQHLTLWSKR